MRSDLWKCWITPGAAYTLKADKTAVVVSVLSTREPQTVTAGVLSKSSYVAEVLLDGLLQCMHFSVHWYPPQGEPQVWYALHSQEMQPGSWTRAYLLEFSQKVPK